LCDGLITDAQQEVLEKARSELHAPAVVPTSLDLTFDSPDEEDWGQEDEHDGLGNSAGCRQSVVKARRSDGEWLITVAYCL